MVTVPAYLAGDEVLAGLLAGTPEPEDRESLLRSVTAGWESGRLPLAALVASDWSLERLEEVAAIARGAETTDLAGHEVDVPLLLSVGIPIARKLQTVPLEESEGCRPVAVARPEDLATRDWARQAFGGDLPVRLLAADADVLESALSAAERSAAAAQMSAATSVAMQGDQPAGDEESERGLLVEGPHLGVINSVLERAASSRASDIHLTPAGNEMIVSIRVDGDLVVLSRQPRRLAEKIVLALIQMSTGVSLLARRTPQDGVIVHTLPSGRQLELRASFIPGAYDLEKVTLRIVDSSKGVPAMDSLGFSPRVLDSLERVVKSPYGVLLVAGPTGSGKTTTLYSVLDSMNDGTRNILTVENPIELMLPGVHQVSVAPEIGLTFGSTLARFLRADPDVMLVGEIRDLETAETATQAAQTGHLVLSTLHTNTAAGVPPRLIQMGVEPYAVSSGLIAALNQRLVKHLCQSCKVPDDPSAYDSYGNIWGEQRPKQIWKASKQGCSRCEMRGYRGRVPVAEMMVITEEIGDLILDRAPSRAIEAAAVSSGMVPMVQDALAKVREGVTDMASYLGFRSISA